MAYPSTVTSYTNPAASDKLNNPSHSSIETAQNTGLTEIQTFVGTTNSSAVGTLIYDIRSPQSNGGGHVQTANKGGTGQTAYIKGDLLVATSASVLSKLGIGTNNNYLMADSNSQSGMQWTSVVATSDVVLPSVKTVLPKPLMPTEPGSADTMTGITFPNTISSMLVGLVKIPFNITANQLAFYGSDDSAGVGHILNVSLYNDSGSRVFTKPVSILNGGGSSTISTLPGWSIVAGNYYVGVNTSIVSSMTAGFWNQDDHTPTATLYIAGKAPFNGTYAIQNGIAPTSIVTTAISGEAPNNKALYFRLDE